MSGVWEDTEILSILHLHDAEGLSFAQIAPRFGVKRSAIAGVVGRVNRAELPCQCEQPQNQDGGMWPLWWMDRSNDAD